jgi:hypothetical protein
VSLGVDEAELEIFWSEVGKISCFKQFILSKIVFELAMAHSLCFRFLLLCASDSDTMRSVRIVASSRRTSTTDPVAR